MSFWCDSVRRDWSYFHLSQGTLMSQGPVVHCTLIDAELWSQSCTQPTGIDEAHSESTRAGVCSSWLDSFP